MRLAVVHETTYRYTSPVALSQQLLHLEPRAAAAQSVEGFALDVIPAPDESARGTDYFGNPVATFAITRPHPELTVRSRFEATVEAHAEGIARRRTDAWDSVRDRLRDLGQPPQLDAAQFLHESPHVELLEELAGYASGSFTPGRAALDATRELGSRIHADYRFDPAATSVATPLREVVARRRGVCQDFAHLMIGCLRALGLPARYVSGYILTHPKPGRARLVGAEASHAWISAYCPPLGWVDVDPTNDCLVNDEHVTVAWGRDFSDVTPLRGVILGGGEQELAVAVKVTALS
jgi:transglutaminase-like putative cysteine protease